MIYSTFFQKILHSPYFIGISRTCCTTYFHPNHPFLPQKHHLNPIFSAPYRQVLSQKRAKSTLFCRYRQVLSPKSTLVGYLWGTCGVLRNLAEISILLLDEYTNYSLLYNFLFRTSPSNSLNSSSSSLSAWFIA